MSSSPQVKFENSPSESFVSTPGEMYPSLFGTGGGNTVNPMEMLSPAHSDDDDDDDDRPSPDLEDLSVLSALTTSVGLPPEEPAPEAGEKRSVKKRKSWGQVLPEPKTNLPPRYLIAHWFLYNVIICN